MENIDFLWANGKRGGSGGEYLLRVVYDINADATQTHCQTTQHEHMLGQEYLTPLVG